MHDPLQVMTEKMPMPDSLPLALSCIWTFKRRDPETGLFVPVARKKNLFTNYGLIQVAGALVNGAQSLYLVIEEFYGDILASIEAGARSVNVDLPVDKPGDTQIVLSPGKSNQEVVSFTSVVNNGGPTGNYTYIFATPCINAHAVDDLVVRQVSVTDTMNITDGEVSYDILTGPYQRAMCAGGYSAGPGNFTFQFYLPANTAPYYITHCGIADAPMVMDGNLLSHFVLGLDNQVSTNDLEIDASLTIANA